MDKDPSDFVLREEEMAYYSAYRSALEDEEQLLMQKTKVQWLKEGDANSAYFPANVKGKRSRNRIYIVYDDQGNGFRGNDITNQFVNHFSGVLGYL